MTSREHPDNSEQAAWHSLAPEEALTGLESSDQGLSEEEARRRLEELGPNRLPETKRRGPLMRLLLQFHNVLIYVLLVAAATTAALGHWLDTAVILGVVVINAFIGFLQEGKAEKALDAIRNLLSSEARVRRNGARKQIPAEELVPGDLVLIQSGDKVPADLRLLEARNLHIEEAALTGESVAVDKSVEPVAADADLGDRRSMAFSSTLVTYGQGVGVVTSTGINTEIGRINTMLAEVEEVATPLLRKLATFGRWLSFAILGFAAVTFLFGILVHEMALGEMFLNAVGLAVAAIPEGLPAIMTITLALGVQQMARRHAIIRRLPVVEALGSVTVICSDKTGTLTRNEMTAQRLLLPEGTVQVDGVGYQPEGSFHLGDGELSPDDALIRGLTRCSLLCNDATLHEEDGLWNVNGDPTEGALVTLAMKSGLDTAEMAREWPRTDAVPFESENQFMATLHHDHNGRGMVCLKGAPEKVLELCRGVRTRQGVQPLDLETWHREMEAVAGEGMRLLAIAERDDEDDRRTLSVEDVRTGGFVLLGMAGLADPPREEAKQAVAACIQAGIQVKMITGDHATTARAIGRQLGLGKEVHAITGSEIEAMSDEQLRRVVGETEIFARASPEHKLRLVTAMQAEGEVVAMTGDGVNDAPALKRADVGVAMGQKGTEVSREASEVVLTDDNFASIVAAVEEGRTVYDNLKKSIIYILPTSGGQAGMVFIAVVLGLSLPVTPVQILWVNMITAVTMSLALAFEKPEPNLMQRPPRNPEEPLLNPFMGWRIAFVSILLVIGAFGLFLWQYYHLGVELEIARTIAINALMIGEAFYLFSCRYLLAPSLHLEGFFGNRYVLLSLAVMLALQLLFTYAPFMQTLFETRGIDLATWGYIVVFGVMVLLIVEAEKAILRRVYQSNY